jgi:hypothetical protein
MIKSMVMAVILGAMEDNTSVSGLTTSVMEKE